MSDRGDHATPFRSFHRPEGGAILVQPNAWDAMSARVIEQGGARAVATTSAGVSWALSRPDAPTIARLAEAVGAPLNIMAGPGAPSVGELAKLGVARVSVGPSITRAIMATIRAAAQELLGERPFLRSQVTALTAAAGQAA